MNRKILAFSLAASILAFVDLSSAAQPKKVARIGWISLYGSRPGPNVAVFLEGLRELGYVEGENVVLEYRFGKGKEDRLPELVAELVHLKVDVIVAASSQAASAVRQLTRPTPIVLTDSADPIGAGLVSGLARPGGNITGSTFMSPELGGKRLELLKETIPRVSHVAVLSAGTLKPADDHFKEMGVVAHGLGVKLLRLQVQEPRDIEKAFLEIATERADALTLISHPRLSQNQTRIVELAAKRRLPAIYHNRAWVETGGLMSYGANHADLFRRAAYFVDRILKGAKPADLPVEQPTKFELVINLKTAKSLGLTIPSKVLMWADRVIE